MQNGYASTTWPCTTGLMDIYKELNKKNTLLNEIQLNCPEMTQRKTGAKFTLKQTQDNQIPTDHPQTMANNELKLEGVQSKYNPTLIDVVFINITSAGLALKMHLPDAVKRN